MIVSCGEALVDLVPHAVAGGRQLGTIVTSRDWRRLVGLGESDQGCA